MSSFFLKSKVEFESAYEKSLANPEEFWSEIASNFWWEKPWESVLKFSMEEAQFSWFEGGKTNITVNCLDRHLVSNGENTAFIFEPNNPEEEVQEITYNDLYIRVCKLANVLRKQGIKKGDRVCIYLPMIPELVVSVLACARIGAIHSVVFAGFSSGALASRIDDCSAKLVITSDGAYRGNKVIDLKSIVDEALISCPTVDKVLVVERTFQAINFVENRDLLLINELETVGDTCEPELMDAEDPLFILYTSGSTGKPKGMMHTTGGYMVYVGYTFQNVFQYNENDIYW
jgi:acetyl-CoA synthetase